MVQQNEIDRDAYIEFLHREPVVTTVDQLNHHLLLVLSVLLQHTDHRPFD